MSSGLTESGGEYVAGKIPETEFYREASRFFSVPCSWIAPGPGPAPFMERHRAEESDHRFCRASDEGRFAGLR